MHLPSFAIVGPQRSGTTLMRLILESHPDVECHDEEEAYRVMERGYSTSAETLVRGVKAPQLTEQFCEAVFYSDAALLRGGDGSIVNRCDQTKLIVMVRSVFDTVASMIDLPMWVEKHGWPVLHAKAIIDPMFGERYRNEFEIISAARHKASVSAALIWLYKTDAIAGYQACGRPLLCVRYEDLVLRTRATLRKVVDFIGVAWDDALVRHEEVAHRELLPNGLAVGFTDPHRAVDGRSVGRWQKRQERMDLDAIERVCGDSRFYG